MAVPVTMQDLALAAASNSPTGTDSIGNTLDDHLRAHCAIMRSMRALSTSSIASAATTNIAASDAEYVVVTGTTSISSLGTGYPGCLREVHFTGSLTL